jgi:hypothetical protein
MVKVMTTRIAVCGFVVAAALFVDGEIEIGFVTGAGTFAMAARSLSF